MREILFRGKDIISGEWITGFLVDAQHIGNWVEAYAIMSETVGQFTGLTDKNGKKIFEGDACRFYGDEGYSDYVAFWDDACSQWAVRQIDFGAKDVLDGFFSEHCEIIGNVHDNPELLEVT